jgi:hypothetical protein
MSRRHPFVVLAILACAPPYEAPADKPTQPAVGEPAPAPAIASAREPSPLASLGDLAGLFDADAGKVRLVLLLEPA